MAQQDARETTRCLESKLVINSTSYKLNVVLIALKRRAVGIMVLKDASTGVPCYGATVLVIIQKRCKGLITVLLSIRCVFGGPREIRVFFIICETMNRDMTVLVTYIDNA